MLCYVMLCYTHILIISTTFEGKWVSSHKKYIPFENEKFLIEQMKADYKKKPYKALTSLPRFNSPNPEYIDLNKYSGQIEMTFLNNRSNRYGSIDGNTRINMSSSLLGRPTNVSSVFLPFVQKNDSKSSPKETIQLKLDNDEFTFYDPYNNNQFTVEFLILDDKYKDQHHLRIRANINLQYYFEVSKKVENNKSFIAIYFGSIIYSIFVDILVEFLLILSNFNK